MFPRCAVSFALIFAVAVSAVGAAGAGLPKGALVLEKRNVKANRQLVLWMMDPEAHPRSAEDDIYTCPDETRGHYYSGVAHVSLTNPKTGKVINAIEIVGDGVSGEDNSIDLPYLIHDGYYSVPRTDSRGEGKPVLIDLRDYNDDGLKHEFALYDALACMGLATTLIGYSEREDKVIQYQTELATPDGTARSFWVDYFFTQKPASKMFWKYEIDYRGRGGTLDKYEIRYEPSKEMFFGTLTTVGDQ